MKRLPQTGEVWRNREGALVVFGERVKTPFGPARFNALPANGHPPYLVDGDGHHLANPYLDLVEPVDE